MMVKGKTWIKWIGLILFLSVSFQAAGQQKLPPLDFDKFRKEIEEIQTAEKKVNHYLEMSLQAMRSRPDSLFLFAEEVRQLPGLEKDKRKAYADFILANGWRACNRDSAIYYGTEAADQLKKIKDHEQYIRVQNLLGLEYRKQSDYLEAEAAYLEGLTYAEKADSAYYPVHYFYGNLGSLYSSVGAHDLAVTMFEQFMEYADNPADRCTILSRLASNLMELDELESAEQMLMPCLDYPNLPPSIASITRSNLSKIVGELGQKDRSLLLMEQAASISVENKVPNLEIAHLTRLGNQYLDQGQTHKADSIRDVINTTDFRALNRHFRLEKALLFSNLALAVGEYDKAISYADSAIHIAESSDLRKFLDEVYATKATAYEHLGELNLAVENMRLQDQLDEQTASVENDKNQAMMQVRYQLKNKENELLVANSRLSILNMRNFLLMGVVLMLGFAGAFIYSRYRKSRTNEALITSELQKRDVTISDLEQKIAEQNSKLKDRNIPDWITLNSQVKLSLDEIRYIQSEGNYVKIFLADTDRAPLMERLTLKECEEKLPDELSLRIHRSTIVNLRHVSHINDQILFLKDSTQLKISRRYKKDLINFLN